MDQVCLGLFKGSPRSIKYRGWLVGCHWGYFIWNFFPPFWFLGQSWIVQCLSFVWDNILPVPLIFQPIFLQLLPFIIFRGWEYSVEHFHILCINLFLFVAPLSWFKSLKILRIGRKRFGYINMTGFRIWSFDCNHLLDKVPVLPADFALVTFELEHFAYICSIDFCALKEKRKATMDGFLRSSHKNEHSWHWKYDDVESKPCGIGWWYFEKNANLAIAIFPIPHRINTDRRKEINQNLLFISKNSQYTSKSIHALMLWQNLKIHLYI